MAHCGLGDSLAYEGRIAPAIRSFRSAIDLSPQDPFRWPFMSYRSLAHLFAGDHAAAAHWARRAVQVPNCALLGDGQPSWRRSATWARTAEGAAATLLHSEPRFTRRFRTRKNVLHQAFRTNLDHFLDGLERAGHFLIGRHRDTGDGPRARLSTERGRAVRQPGLVHPPHYSAAGMSPMSRQRPATSLRSPGPPAKPHRRPEVTDAGQAQIHRLRSVGTAVRPRHAGPASPPGRAAARDADAARGNPTMTFAPLSCLIIDGRGGIGVAFPKD